MARILTGAAVAAISGSLAGSVFHKNGIVRAKAFPTNQSTQAQSINRWSFTYLTRRWKDLSKTEKLSWKNAVLDYKPTDQFGQLKKLTPANLFNKTNMNLFKCNLYEHDGNIGLQTAPTKGMVTEPIITASAINTSTLHLTITVNPPSADEVFYIEATRPLRSNDPNSFYGDKFKFVATNKRPPYDFPPGEDPSGKNFYIVAFANSNLGPDPSPGRWMIIRIRYINSKTGQQSQLNTFQVQCT